MSEARTLVVVVTGMSGAGRSTAVHALEDLGFFCVDNLPTPVVQSTVESVERSGVRRIALGIDARVRSYLGEAAQVIERMSGEHGPRQMVVLFLDAADELLLRRFNTTRRRHPLSTFSGRAQAPAVLDGIRRERELMEPLRALATAVIDTTELSVHDLRAQVTAMFGPGADGDTRMSARIESFGFKYGLPIDADLVLDVRFLKNPYFEPELQRLSGLDAAVREYVLGNPETQEWLATTLPLLEFCLPRFEREGKSYLTIAVGCTGGRHRSVALAEHLAQELTRRLDLAPRAVHRDIHRAEKSSRYPRAEESSSGASEAAPGGEKA
jgi:UPF0042 nucleotide-binding protein